MAARITDPAIIAALSTKLKDLPPGLLALLALNLSSTAAEGSSENHAWLGTSRSFREWIGKRLAQQPNAFDFAITNKKYENGGTLPLALINNDRSDETDLWLDDLVATLPLWKEELLAILISQGESVVCFDGQFYFDTDHKFGAQTTAWSNDLTADVATPAAVTAYEAAVAINAAIEAMRVFPDDQGRAIANRGMNAIDVICTAGTPNAAAIRQAMSSKTLDTGTGPVDNPLMGQDVKLSLVSDGLITLGATKFVTARSRRLGDAGARPFVFQENMNERRIDVLGENAPQYIVENDGYGVFLKVIGAAGYGLPSHACLTTFI